MPRIDPGSIWLANLEPQRGTEPGKVRPVLVVQGDALLDAGHPSTLIVPLTTNLVGDAEPLRIRVRAFGRLRKDSDLLIDQLRAIDNRRLTGRPLGRLSDEQLRKVRSAVLLKCCCVHTFCLGVSPKRYEKYLRCKSRARAASN